MDLLITCKTFVPPKPNPWVVSTWVVSKNRGHNPCVPIAQPKDTVIVLLTKDTGGDIVRRIVFDEYLFR